MEHVVLSPANAARIGKANQAMAWLRRRRWFALFVILPTVIATLYYGLIASDVYVSEARFVIKAPSQKQAQLSSLANLIQTTGLSAGQEQANEVLEYVRSRSALEALQKRVDVRDKFMTDEADFLSRFPAPFREDRFENLYKYYGKMVEARLDKDTGTAVLAVKAFNPEDAWQINSGLLALSEELVNRLNDRAQGKAIAEAENRVAGAQGRLRKARIALQQYRNASVLLDPVKQASGVLDVSNRLVAERAALLAQLEAMVRAAPANPAIPALRSRIVAISTQIAAQTGRAVGTEGGIASKLGEYEKLAMEQEFAGQMLTAAEATLEQSRNEARKQQFYLERIVEPNRPDMALLPERLKQILVVAAAAVCLYFIGWMLIVGILEHSPED